MRADAERYAIHFAPVPHSALWRAGSRWIGRDAASGERFTTPAVEGGKPDTLKALTRSPRFYGFHATLKAPFHLRENETFESLTRATQEMVAECPSFALPTLRIAGLGNFIALVLSSSCSEIENLASRCVRSLDRFRAPGSEEDLKWRREQAELSPRQDALLNDWGYPYVLDEYRFHMTLTGSIADQELRQQLISTLEERFAHLLETPTIVDAICLFYQRNREQPFRIVERIALCA